MGKKLQVSINEKYYNNAKLCILQDCIFEVKPGEFVTILGASGCGKSTVLKTILGLDSNFKGTVKLGNELITGPSRNCGIVFQDPRLLPWMTVERNIAYALPSKNSNREEICELLELLELKEFAKEFPSSLSGGMAQKVALARALINLPDLLLLDEPFASLDYITRMRLQNELIKLLFELQTSVLMVTHDIEEAVFVSDRILVMSPKPSKIVKVFEVKLKKPRDRSSKEFLEYYQAVLDYMMDVLHII